jgi:hypothetical protein
MRGRGAISGESAGRRGATLLELVASALLLSFVVAAASKLFQVGHASHTMVRHYSQAQSDLREALRRATWGMRHGYGVVATSTAGNFPVQASNTAQAILLLPEPTGSNPAQVQVRYHVTNGILYAQRANEAAPGMALLPGVQNVTFAYYQTNGATRVPVNGTPALATEVEIQATARRHRWNTKVSTLVNLRNSITGL